MASADGPRPAKGTSNQSISFGDFAIEVAFSKTTFSRDPKTEYVRDELNPETGEVVPVTVTMSGASRGGGSGSRTVADDVYKAVRVSPDKVLRLDPAVLEEVERQSVETWKTMTVLETIDYRSVPTERITGSYWVQPRNGTGFALALLTKALYESDRVAVVKWVATTREKLGILRPRRSGTAMMLCELAFANDFREPDEDVLLGEFADQISDAALDAAKQLVQSLGRPRGGEQRVDTASDSAVDARLTYIERLHAEQFEQAVSAAAERVPVT